MQLVDAQSGEAIPNGSERRSYRIGTPVIVVGFTPPKHESCEGRVQCLDKDGRMYEWYPHIIDAKIVDGVATK